MVYVADPGYVTLLVEVCLEIKQIFKKSIPFCLDLTSRWTWCWNPRTSWSWRSCQGSTWECPASPPSTISRSSSLWGASTAWINTRWKHFLTVDVAIFEIMLNKCYKCWNYLNSYINLCCGFASLHYLDGDPDPAFHFDADPDPTLTLTFFDVNPDKQHWEHHVLFRDPCLQVLSPIGFLGRYFLDMDRFKIDLAFKKFNKSGFL